MARPTTKKKLLEDISKERDALEDYLRSLSPEHMLQPGIVGRWSVKDVLAHLVAWEQMFLGWYQTGQQGKIPLLPAQGFTWGQLPALNQQIYQRHRDQPLAKVRQQFKASYQKLFRLLQGLSEEELFSPGHYAWAGTHPLATYILPNTSSHYRWAQAAMRKGFKARPKAKPNAKN
jgi:hypothetical protein